MVLPTPGRREEMTDGGQGSLSPQSFVYVIQPGASLEGNFVLVLSTKVVAVAGA